MAFRGFAHSPDSAQSATFSPISPVTSNVTTVTVSTRQLNDLHQRIEFLSTKLQEVVESRDHYANLYYSTKQKLETTRSNLHYVMQHLNFIGNQVTTVVAQVEGDHLQPHKSSSHSTVEPSTKQFTTSLKRPESLIVIPSHSIPSKPVLLSSNLQRNRKLASTNSLKSTTTGSSSEASPASATNLEYKSYKGISSNEFVDLCQQLSDPNCPFSYLQLSNCRMGSVEVMETFCYNLTKNTSLVELSLTNVGIKQDSLIVLLKCLLHMNNIRVLRLQYNKIGEDCCNTLKSFVTKSHLMFLDLKGNPIEDSSVVKEELEKLCNHPGRCIIRFHEKQTANGKASCSNGDNITQL